MQLRYGELGQMLTGTAEGARFAFHVEDDNGDFGGWLAAVKAATEHEPVVKQTVAFDLARVLALAAGD
jgi:hypothetical protein